MRMSNEKQSNYSQIGMQTSETKREWRSSLVYEVKCPQRYIPSPLTLCGTSDFWRSCANDKKRQAPTVRPPTPDNDSPTGTGSPRRRGSSSTSPPPKPPRPTQTSPTQHKKSRSKSHSSVQSQQSFKPIDFAKERPAILETIAAGQQCATNLSNALKRLNRETQHPNDDPQILQLYRQCRKLRRDILNYIQRTESEEWIGTLINANEELVQALSRYETALKPVEEDSDSDAWSVSDSDEERKKKESRSKSMGNMSSATSPISHQRQTSTGGSGRSAIAEDLAQRLRATSLSQQRSGSQEAPPPKPPRPTSQVEIPPPRPPRPMPMQKPIPLPKPKSLVSKGKQPAETIATDDEDPFGDEHGIDAPAGSKGRKGWLEL